MTKKFNPKEYQGKARIYRAVKGAPSVYRLYVWDAERAQYDAPVRGKIYEAYRKEIVDGKSKRVKQCFERLEDAREWQTLGTSSVRENEQGATPALPAAIDKGPLFHEVIERWKLSRYPRLEETTRTSYDSKLKNHFASLFQVPIRDITRKTVDDWIFEMRKNGVKCSRRRGFKNELGVLSAILSYYAEYEDDAKFHFPISDRHWEAIRPKKCASKAKDLTEVEFWQFHSELEKGRYGNVLAPLAIVQYFQALRISEAGAIHWEDIRFNVLDPMESRLLIRRKIVHTRKAGEPAYVKDGFKNAKDFGEVKEQPLFPYSHQALASLWREDGITGLVFQIEGKPIGYRTLQYFYDQSFKRAGLPYTATHVLRHGWTREVFNSTPDIEIAKQLLGDKSDSAARVYAIRRASGLTAIAQKQWKQFEAVRNCSQNEEEKEQLS